LISRFFDGGVAMKLFAWVALPVVGAVAWMMFAQSPVRGEKKLDNRFFELRTYYAAPGKMADLHARFRDGRMGSVNQLLHMRYGATTAKYDVKTKTSKNVSS
jgi:hypothetical protein